MTGAAPIPFIKMHGLGNDFVVIDARSGVVPPGKSLIPLLCDRRLGIGCDQVVILEGAPLVEAQVRFYNADGSESPACGNATRCVAYLLMEASGDERCVMKIDGRRTLATRDRRKNPRAISVDMGKPSFDWKDVPLREERDVMNLECDEPGLPLGAVVSVGNPHLVFFVENAPGIDVARVGSRLETHALFPDRVNVHIVSVLGENALMMRTWERGSGLTQACGTGACAAFAVAAKKGIVDASAVVSVHMRGGKVALSYSQNGSLMMKGPTATVFVGTVDVDALSRDA
ncbi:MAG: diaminopimelate epimerase [Rickettsiales bacterium]